MPSLKEFTDSLLAVWTESTPAARLGMVGLLVLSIVMLGFVGYWSSQPSYVTLVSGSDTEITSKLVDELAKLGIDYEIGGAGGVVRVDARHLARARIAANKIGANVAEQGGMGGGTGTMWMTKEERQQMSTAEKARVLEETIRGFDSVGDAKVILNIPVRGPFERVVAKPSAAVQLRLTERLRDVNVLAIAELVASAVVNLEPVNVKITDSLANLYPVPDPSTNRVNDQAGYIEQEERKFIAKAEAQLLKLFGPGNASVQVSTDYTFIDSTTQSTEYDASGRVAEKEVIDTSETKTGSTDPNGAAGVASNLNASTTGAGISGQNEKTESLTNEYKIPETTQTQTNNRITRNYLTISVLVNDLAAGVKLEDGSLDPNLKPRVEQLVRNAVGFQEETDKITVEFAPFPTAEEVVVATPFNWEQLNEVLRNVSLAVAALVVFALGFLTLRHFRGSQTVVSSAAATDPATQVNQLNDLARDNPEVFARILKSWAGDGPGQTTSTNDTTSSRNAA